MFVWYVAYVNGLKSQLTDMYKPLYYVTNLENLMLLVYIKNYKKKS